MKMTAIYSPEGHLLGHVDRDRCSEFHAGLEINDQVMPDRPLTERPAISHITNFRLYWRRLKFVDPANDDRVDHTYLVAREGLLPDSFWDWPGVVRFSPEAWVER